MSGENNEYSGVDSHAKRFKRNDTRRQRALEEVRRLGWALEVVPEDLQNDREIVMEAVKQFGGALQFASAALKNDREIVLAAVKQYGWALQFASAALKNDREIVLEAVKQNGWALQYASADLKNDREIVLEAVKRHGWALRFASEDLRDDPTVVSKALRDFVPNRRGWVQYIGETLKTRIKDVIIVLGDLGMLSGDRTRFDDTEAVLVYANHWKQRLWEKTWLVLDQLPAHCDQRFIPTEVRSRVLDFAGSPEFQQACELVHVAPVIGEDARLRSPQISRLFPVQH